mmetsp:Transcript_35785/g.113037  ORF Transcript_35785/g.113037 Transcript_35785/m.113037 type:complete len:465 (-) Transcript_35785:1825-3219(-)
MFFLRKVFVAGFSLVLFSAFASLQCQWDGLYGHHGVLPVDAYLERIGPRVGSSSLMQKMRTLPSLLWLHDLLGMDADVMGEWICLAGMALSACSFLLAVISRGGGWAPLLAGCWLCYLSLLQVGQTFLSFQWDILLLETGFVAMFLPPFFKPSSSTRPSPVVVWLLRFILFKLMLMSGVVKLQSGCPTWHGLTALDYHFATQCLPTPLAWTAHTLTPAPLKAFGVAATLWLEGPAVFLLILPFRDLRVAGAYMQIVLQVLIASTGNYNFFNALTALLALVCMDDRSLRRLFKCPERESAAGRGPGQSGAPEAPASQTPFDSKPLLPRTPARGKKHPSPPMGGVIRAPADSDDTSGGGGGSVSACGDGMGGDEVTSENTRRPRGILARAWVMLLNSSAVVVLAVTWGAMFDVGTAEGAVRLKMTTAEMEAWLDVLLVKGRRGKDPPLPRAPSVPPPVLASSKEPS